MTLPETDTVGPCLMLNDFGVPTFIEATEAAAFAFVACRCEYLRALRLQQFRSFGALIFELGSWMPMSYCCAGSVGFEYDLEQVAVLLTIRRSSDYTIVE
jgi:hypothetical protein